MDERTNRNVIRDSSGSTVQAVNVRDVHYHQNSSGKPAIPADDLDGYRISLISRLVISASRASLVNGLSGGRNRRIQRAARRLETAFASGAQPSADLGRLYRGAMRTALILRPELAISWFEAYDRYIPAERYLLTFREGDACWLAWLVRTGDLSAANTVFELATRMQLRPLQVLAREYSAKLLRRSRDGAALVRHYQRWLAEDLLDEPTVTYSLKPYLDAGRLDQDPGLWTDFFGKLPEPLLPDHFEVHCLLGHGVQAVRSAKNRVRPGPGGAVLPVFPAARTTSRPDWSLPATACGIRQQSGDWRSMPVTFSGAPANCPLPRSAISSRVAATWPVSATRK